MVRNGWWQEHGTVGHTVPAVSRQRWMLVLSSPSPYDSAQDPNPWSDAAHTEGLPSSTDHFWKHSDRLTRR